MLISASVLAADMLCLKKDIARMDAHADWHHVDVMDGSFVPNISFGQNMMRALSGVTDKPLDVHFMVRDAVPMLDEFAKLGASRMTVHAEAVGHLHRVLGHIRDLGVKAGVALNPATPPEAIDYVLDVADMILVMTVSPGFGGQKLIPLALQKAEAVKNRILQSGRDILLEIDGGAGAETIESIRSAGVDVVVAGSSFYGRGGANFARKVHAL